MFLFFFLWAPAGKVYISNIHFYVSHKPPTLHFFSNWDMIGLREEMLRTEREYCC